jgi:hypothetical protein
MHTYAPQLVQPADVIVANSTVLPAAKLNTPVSIFMPSGGTDSNALGTLAVYTMMAALCESPIARYFGGHYRTRSPIVR